MILALIFTFEAELGSMPGKYYNALKMCYFFKDSASKLFD